MTKTTKSKMLSFLLCFVMIATTFCQTAMTAQAAGTKDITVTDAQGTAVQDVTLPKNGPKDQKTRLTARAGVSADAKYQWQILASADPELWVDIRGEKAAEISVSYPMVRNLIDKDTGSTSLRCKIKDGSKTLTSDAVKVTAGEKVRAEAAHPTKAEIRKAAAKTATPATPQADDEITAANDGEENSTYSIIINYVFADGKQAANPWTATVAKGSSYKQDVKSPTVVGYAPDSATVNVDVTDIQADKTYIVTYKPAEVEYTVKHYQQNVDNDKYTLKDTETKKGCTESAVGDKLAKTYTGFTALLYDTTTKIAADGSTVVEIYYDRNYYLMTFDLDGGYGVEPIYARYGTKIEVDNTKLKKAGYTFDGWDKEIPATMPAENTAYKASWTATDKVKATVVIWGENADDENYSYIDSNEIYAKPGTTIKYGSTDPICGQEEHKHNASCGYACGKTAHTHSSKCCSLTEHSHGYSCYPGATSETQSFAIYKPPTSPKQGEVYIKSGIWDTYKWIYIGNTWYKYEGDASSGSFVERNCNMDEHTHGSGCNHANCGYKEEHTHSALCGYNCGKTEHTHDSGCYLNDSTMDSKLWSYNKEKSESVTVAADGTTIMNVYYDRTEFTLTFKDSRTTVKTIKEKWGKDIHHEFPIKDGNQTIWWTVPEECQSFVPGNYLGSIDTMPAENITFTKYKSESGANIYYYVETLNGEKGDVSYKGKNYKLYKNIDLEYNQYTKLTYKEEFHDIKGFQQGDSNPTLNAPDGSVGMKQNNYLYYTRNSYDLSFYNYNAVVKGKDSKVQYEAPLSSYNFTPDYPSDLEPNAYEFKGWYTTSGCYDGSEVDWDKMTMPDSDVMLYAKWAPKTHTVTTWLTDEKKTPVNVGTSNIQTVLHGNTAAKPDDPENGNYTFVGWFYKENGVEKAFDFSIPVNKDLDLYAKWSSNTLVEYTIKYTLEDGTVIASETTGSALAGTTKTFDAKTGTELNEGYQKGYFPESSSHSITMGIDGNNEYTFVYVPREKVKYTVRYLEKGTNKVLADQETKETSDAVITEKFKQIKGYAPDAYQKRLVLSANDKDNVITFWYTKDDVHAPVQIIHWTQNIADDGYTEYQSSTDLNGVIGETYTENPLDMSGFSYNGTKSNASGTLTAEGLVLNLYYDRIEYPYEFRFLEQGTDKKLADPVTGNARYQAQVTQTAKDIPGYTLVSAENQAINIAIEDPANLAKENVKTFYYTEQTVDIKYQVVGPTGCGTLDNYQDNGVKVKTGTVKGSAPTPAKGYKFAGWYKDEACKQAVDSDWIDANKLTPKKEGSDPAMYKAATYYAKFEKDVADLTIKKTGCSDADENQSFIFDVKDKNGKLITTVTIHGNSSATIKDLQIDEYTVTEKTEWSWRYEPTKNDQRITLDVDKKNEITFVNKRETTNWLNGSSWCRNVFKGNTIESEKTTTPTGN